MMARCRWTKSCLCESPFDASAHEHSPPASREGARRTHHRRIPRDGRTGGQMWSSGRRRQPQRRGCCASFNKGGHASRERQPVEGVLSFRLHLVVYACATQTCARRLSSHEVRTREESGSEMAVLCSDAAQARRAQSCLEAEDTTTLHCSGIDTAAARRESACLLCCFRTAAAAAPTLGSTDHRCQSQPRLRVEGRYAACGVLGGHRFRRIARRGLHADLSGSTPHLRSEGRQQARRVLG